MKIRIAFILLTVIAPVLRMQAQEVPPIRIVDVENVTTLVESPTSSSSSSCSSPDFPVLKGGMRKDINFNDLEWITVRHDIPAENENIYITVELTARDGTTEILEMIRGIRFSGSADGEPFSIPVKDISTVQVMHKPY